jgi:hypothetical protein
MALTLHGGGQGFESPRLHSDGYGWSYAGSGLADLAWWWRCYGIRLATYSNGRGGAHDSRTMSDVASSTRVFSRGSPATIRSSILVARAPILRTG